MAFTDILDPTKGLKQIKKKTFTPKLPTVTKAVATPKVSVVDETPVESENARIARERHEAEQAFQAKQDVDLTSETFEQRKSKADELKNALTQQVPEAPVATQGPSVSDQLKAQSDAQTQALLAELKQRIADSVAGQQQIISQAPQQFDPLRAQSEVGKAQQLRSALERSSVLGDRGGIGRSEALATQTAGEQRLTDINLAQQNVIDNAKAEIASLQREGDFQAAAIKANQLAQLTESLISQQQRQEDIAREDLLLEEERGLQTTEQKKQDFINTITRFAQDYTAEINRVQNDSDPTNDWQIPLLETARQDKITTEGLDPLTGEPLPRDTTPTLTSSSALDLWEQTGVANEAISRALGVPVGERFTRRTTGGGTGGTSGLTETSIRYKLSNGIPLNAEEAASFGVEEGYVSPEATTVDNEFAEDLAQFIQDKGGDTKQSVIEYLINNDGRYSIEWGYKVLDDYGLKPSDLQRVINVNPSIGQ